jgi:hypothetical protein
MALIAESDPSGGLFECYCRERLDCIDIDSLNNGLRTREDDRRIARDVCLEMSVSIALVAY